MSDRPIVPAAGSIPSCAIRQVKTPARRLLTLLVAFSALCSLLGALVASPGLAAPATSEVVPTAGPRVAPLAQPAAGRHVALLTVSAFGRYAVSVASAQGVALELVDRMAGTLARDGGAGTADGRVDVFLDRGEYRIVLLGAERAQGNATVRVDASAELSAAPGPVLEEQKPIASALDDHQQRSWWLRVAERRTVFLETGGRNVRDVRLWRDGSWLVDAAPRCVARQPIVGRPVVVCQLSTTLEKGLYRLSVYGGAPQPWAQGGDAAVDAGGAEAHALSVRWGVSMLPAAGRRRFVIGPLGVDRYVLPVSTNYARLELPATGAAELRGGNVLTNDPYFRLIKAQADIVKQTRPPVAEVTIPEATQEDRETDAATMDAAELRAAQEAAAAAAPESASGDETMATDETSASEETAAPEETTDDESASADESSSAEESTSDDSTPPAPTPHWIEVAGTPGQAYVLEQFELQQVYTFERGGKYWVSTVQAGGVGDEADASGLLIGSRNQGDVRRDTVVAKAALPLGANRPFARRFNALDDTGLFFEVETAGTYQVVGRGAQARFRFEPFYTSPPRGYKSPPFKGSGETWTLNPGLYLLSIRPDTKGVLDLAVRAAGATGSPWAGLETGGGEFVARGEARFGTVDLQAGESYSLLSGERSGVRTGVVLRSWPLDLAQPLPLALRPGESVTLDGTSNVAGTLRLEGEDGTALPIAVDDAPPSTAAAIAPGTHRLTLTAPATATRTSSAALVLTETRINPDLPDAPLPQADLDALPKFPELAPGQPAHFDLAANQVATFLVRSSRPALYAVSSTGLLHTSGALRTRTVAALVSDDGNGVGRNFELRPYLGAGDFQLSVTARGWSAGHLGVELHETPLRDGGALRDGVAARASLAAGEGIAYRFHVAQTADVRLRGAGDGFTFRCRVEDADGWPVGAPEAEANLKLHLLPGDYRLILLPRSAAAKSLALIETESTAAVAKGHAPVDLELGEEAAHVWLESPADQTRQPDVYRFRLAATAHVAVKIDNEMQGSLQQKGGAAGAAIFVPPGRGWSGELEPGDYTLSVECSRRNNLVAYAVSVTPDELVAGMERSIAAPAEVPVSVGDTGMTEIVSHAFAAVRGVLLDAQGNVVLRAGARPDDWNFLLSGRLAPGRYRLRVESISGNELTVGLVMRSRVETDERAAALPWSRSFDPGESVHIVALPAARGGAELLVAGATSAENIGLAIERRDGGVWRTLSNAAGRAPRVAAALGATGGDELRLRVWSIDERGEPLRLQVAAVKPKHVREAQLAAGAPLGALRDLAQTAPDLAAVVVDLDRPGVLRFASLTDDLLQAGGPGPLLPSEDGQLVAFGRRAFLLGRNGAAVQAKRLAAAATGAVRLRVPASGPAVVDLQTAAGPLVVEARSLSIQPGVRAGVVDAASGSAMAVADGAAMSVALAKADPVALVWSAAGGSGDVDVEVARPALQSARTAAWGVLEGVLTGDVALPIDLPPGAKRVSLALGAQSAAALADGDRVSGVHWQGGEAFERSLDSTAARVLLIHRGAQPAPYRVEIAPADAAAALRAGAPREELFDRSGSDWFRVEAATTAGGLALHVRGADAAGTFVGDDGTVLRGNDLQPHGAGAWIVRHGPGAVLAWLDAGGVAASPWSLANLAAVVQTAPGVVALGGRDVRLKVPLAAQAVLQVRTRVPVASVVSRAAGAEVEIHPAGARLQALGEGDGVEVLLHGLATGLSGVAELATTAVVPLVEGVNAPVLLAGGDRAYFSFEIASPRRVGVGVRTDASGLECELLTAGGRALGHGVLQLVDLEPGRYLLVLEQPANAAPAAARPVIVGLSAPGNGPPPEVIRTYMLDATQSNGAGGGGQ